MASKDKLWFEMGVRDDVSKVLDSLLGKTTRLQQALVGATKDFGFKNAFKNAAELESAFDKIATALSKVQKAKLTTTDNGMLKELDQVEKKLKKMQREFNGLWRDLKKNPNSVEGGLDTAGLVKSFADKQGLNLAMEQVNRLLRTNETSQKKAASAARDNARANQSLMNSYNKVTEAARGTNRILEQFKNQFAGLVGLYGLERLAKSIVTIGGQFEYQHIALQNILGDAEKANTLFSQLQELAVNSPKTFMELTSYSKQLSAYQIPYEELFDTTKRLADISTGLGVDMGRLILAYGQVRSAAVLRGQELRQFTEAGIPMVQKLAEKFTELNGRMVTTGEVFELISKRAVPFKMVQEVLWDMTDEGGQFYDMQGQLADTLYGKWQKLQDTWQIMLGHIADGEGAAGKFLKNTIELVVGLTRALDTLLPVLAFGGLGRILTKGVLGSKSMYQNYSGFTAVKNMELVKMQKANALERERVMLGKELTKAEMSLVATKERLTSNELKLLLAEKQITQQQMFQLAQAGKINKYSVARVAYALGYTKQQIQQIMNGNTQLIQEKQLSMWRRAGNSFMGFMGGGIGLGLTAATTALGAYLAMDARNEEQISRAKDSAGEAAQNMASNITDFKKLYDELSSSTPNLEEGINKITEALKKNNRYTKEIDAQVNSVDTLSKKYNILFSELEKVSNEYLRMKENARLALEQAGMIGGGLFSSNMSENLGKWSNSMTEAKGVLQGMKRYSSEVRTWLVDFIKESGEWNEETMGNASWEALFNGLSANGQDLFKNFANARRKGDYDNKVYTKIREYIDALENIRELGDAVGEKIPDYADYVKSALDAQFSVQGLDLSQASSWDDKNLDSLRKSINSIIGSYNLDSDIANEFRARLYRELFDSNTAKRIEGLPEYISSTMAPWQEELQRYLDEHTPELHMTVDAQSTFESMQKALQTKREELQEQMDTAGRILLNVGFDMSNLPKDIDRALLSVPAWKQEMVKQAFERYNSGRTGIEGTKKVEEEIGLLSLKEKKTTGGSKADTQLKAAKTRFDELKSFLSEYRKYREIYGDNKSVSILEEMFPTMSGKGKQAVSDFKAVLREIKDSLPMTSEERKKFGIGIDKFVADYDLNEAKRKLDQDLRDLQEFIQKRTSQWNLYKALFEKTGDKTFARNAFSDMRVFDEVSRELERKLKETSGESQVDYSMSQVAAEKHYENNKQAYELWKKIVDITSKNWVDTLNAGADAEAKLLTNAEKLKKVQEEIAELNGKIANTNNPTILRSLNMQKLNKEAEGRKLESDIFKESEDYVKFFASVSTLTAEASEKMGDTIKNHLLTEFIEGDITARQYTKSIKDVNEQLAKNRKATDGLSAFMKGGSDGLLTFLDDMVANAANDVERKKDNLDDINKRIAQGEERLESKRQGAEEDLADSKKNLNNTEKLAKKFKEIVSSLSDAAFYLNIVADIFDGIEQVGKNLSGMFEALGNKQEAEYWEDLAANANIVSSPFKSASNAIQSASKGDISGTLGNVVGMFTSPITAAAKLHDKDIERDIERSKNVVKALTTEYSNLQKEMERALGGVFNKNNSAAMLSNLQQQRMEIQRQIELEEGKKNSDDDRLSELRQSLKELDESIEDFSENLAKNLYGIDLNDWARQLTNAVVGAWEAGTDAAEAYRTSVKDIMKDVLVNALTKKAMEMYFEHIDLDSLLTKAMGGKTKSEVAELTNQLALIDKALNGTYWDKVGAYSKLGGGTSYKRENMDEFLRNKKEEITGEISSYGEISEQGIKELSQSLNDGAITVSDFIVKILDSLEADGAIDRGNGGSSLSSNIKGITEGTADLLASYLNAIRADVSVSREIFNQMLAAVREQSGMPVIARAQLEQLQLIASNTNKNAGLVQEIRDILHTNINKGNRFNI